MSVMAKQDYAVLGFAVLSCLFASGAFFVSLRNQRQTPASSALIIGTPPEITKDDDKANKDDVPSDESNPDKEKASAVSEKAEIIDEAYKRIHQRYNRKDYKWEDFDPLAESTTHEGVIFIVYHRHYEPMAVRPLERLVEVQSEGLREVLKGCLKHIDTVFDPKPMV